MDQRTIAIVLLSALLASVVSAGPFSPPAGDPNSTAISMADPNFVGWATGPVGDPNMIDRGYLNVSNPGLGKVGFGEPNNVLGPATGDSFGVASLGDGGSVTVTFSRPIANGPGNDFSVFENSFDGMFLELGFVEVSSDGENFIRFDAISLTQTESQIVGFGTLDTTDLHNFAGKYQQGYGTPFDLEELKDVDPLVDVGRITHVRIIDVVGGLDDLYARFDSLGNKINDPWPTDFDTGGFDLDAVGVLHEKTWVGDFDGDGIVNLFDFQVFATSYLSGPSDQNWNSHYDISQPADEIIDVLDFIRFVQEWLLTESWYAQS